MYVLGFGLVSVGALLAADNKYAKLIEDSKFSIKGVKFKDTVGTPFTNKWKARFYLNVTVFNPTSFSFPLTLDKINLLVGQGLQAASLVGKKELIIEKDLNIFPNILVEVPLTTATFQAITHLSNPRVLVKARVYQLPIEFTYDIEV